MQNGNVSDRFISTTVDKTVNTFWDDDIRTGRFTRSGDRVFVVITDMRGNEAAAVLSQTNLKELIANLQELVINND